MQFSLRALMLTISVASLALAAWSYLGWMASVAVAAPIVAAALAFRKTGNWKSALACAALALLAWGALVPALTPPYDTGAPFHGR